jgi:hypothetical protein
VVAQPLIADQAAVALRMLATIDLDHEPPFAANEVAT